MKIRGLLSAFSAFFLVWATMANAQTPSAPPQPLSVAGGLNITPTAEGATLRLAFSRALVFQPKYFYLPNPMRIVIDIHGASSLRREMIATGDIKAARVSQFDPQTIRVVFDLARPMRLETAFQDKGQTMEVRLRPITAEAFRAQTALGRRTFTNFLREAPLAVPPGPNAPTDLAADSARRIADIEAVLADVEQTLKPAEAVTPPKVMTPPKAVETPKPPVQKAEAPKPATPSAKGSRPKPNSRGTYVVMLDAGHGGHDPGAPSASTNGVEKTVTLALALGARDAIRRQARAAGINVDVRLTRADDRYLTLGQRVRLARQSNAHLFVSIHADSAANTEARGATVYTLSSVASDKEAARVAAKENRADLIAGVDLSGEDREVASILVDLGMRDSMNASADFAQAIQKGMEPRGVLFRSNFHRFANFQVLRNLGVPAVLFEAGFLSNAEDSKILFSEKGQKAIADGMGKAVVDYLSHRAY